MSYQEYLDNIKNDTKLNTFNYLMSVKNTQPKFDWFEITPELKTHDGENTCLFYKIFFEDFDLGQRYFVDMFYALTKNQKKKFQTQDLAFFREQKDSLTPFVKSHFARKITSSKKMSDCFDVDIDLATENEFFVKGLLSQYYNTNEISAQVKQTDFYHVLDKLIQIYLTPEQKQSINQTEALIDNYKLNTVQKSDEKSHEYVIDYLQTVNLQVNNDYALMAIFSPLLKSVLNYPKLTTDNKKRIIDSLPSNIPFGQNELLDCLTLTYSQNTKPGELSYVNKVNYNSNSLMKKLFFITHISLLNDKVLENKIELEKDYLSNIISDKALISKKLKV